MAEDVRRRINSDWAATVAAIRPTIWFYNRDNARSVADDIPLQDLGGLVISCSQRVYDADWAEDAARGDAVVNLAFDEPAYLTSTFALVEAAMAANPRSVLSHQLMDRQIPTQSHGSNETWILPVAAFDS